MTIETSPASNLFAGFNDDEKKMLAVAVRRVEELEETRRITAGMAGQAQAIQSDLKARGVDDAHVLREAAEAVDATLKAQGKLASEVQDYRKLFGPDGRAASAVGQYTQLLRNAHAGDVDALNHVQSARRELYEARDASAQNRGQSQSRYVVMDEHPLSEKKAVLETDSAREASDYLDRQRDFKRVLERSTGATLASVGAEDQPVWKDPGFAKEVERERQLHQPVPHELTQAQFAEVALASSLEEDGHPRKWRVQFGRQHAFSDEATASKAVADVHEALVNNAIYAHLHDRDKNGLPPAAPSAQVLADYPHLEKMLKEVSQPRYEVRSTDPKTLEETTVLATSNALEAHDAFYGKQDREVFDRQARKLVGYVGADTHEGQTWKMRAGFAEEVAALQGKTAQAPANLIEQDGPLREKQVAPGLVQPDPDAASARDEKRPQAVDLRQVLPESFAGRYQKSGDKWVEAGNPAHVIVIDKGSKLQVPKDFDAESVKAAVDLAQARGWSSMKVSGDKQFCQALFIEAASRGIEVKGYKPTDAEKRFADTNAAKLMKSSNTTENDVAKAFQGARTPAERRKAAETHPELKKAFAIEAAYSQMAKQIQNKVGQEAFMTRMRDNIANDLAQGREMVDIRLRRPMFKQAEYSRIQDRDQSQSQGR